ncbi:MAG: hypothetical protein ACI80N_002215, partial [Gammaproteobacteria bacterium]
MQQSILTLIKPSRLLAPKVALGILLLAGGTFAQTPVDVDVRIVDQAGADLGGQYPAGFTIISINGASANSGGTVSLLPGTYNARIHLVYGDLYRDLTGVSITPTTTNLDFEWITESLTVSVKDQGGVLVPGSG